MINNKDYLNILGDHVHLMVQTLISDGERIFQDDNAPMHTAHVFKNWYEKGTRTYGVATTISKSQHY